MSKGDEDKVAALLRLFEQYGLEELLVEEPGFTLHLRGGAPGVEPSGPIPAPAASASPAAPEETNRLAVRSPLIGIFYRSSAPDLPAFVDEGDVIEEGQTVCIVEAMKVFNEIKSEWPGRVVEIPAQNGKLVQAGDPLVVLEPLNEH